MTPTPTTKELVFKWAISRGRRTPGYRVCTLYVDGRKVSRCNGGGYDMRGVALANYIESAYAERLRAGIVKPYSGLTFHDPNYDPGKAASTYSPGLTVNEAEAAGKSLGLERLQAAYAASAPLPSETHTVPVMDGVGGMESVSRIMKAIGLHLQTVKETARADYYTLTDEIQG